MDFKNRLKGTVTQTLMRTLLEDAGYRTLPLGIEDVLRELKILQISEYHNLGLPVVLRKMPDCFVADKDFKNYWLVEVKYRKEWNAETRKSLGDQILEQVSLWQPLHLVVFLGNSTKPGQDDTPARRLRVAKLYFDASGLYLENKYQTHDPSMEWVSKTRRVEWSQAEWTDLSRFQDVFVDVTPKWGDSTLINSVNLLSSLRELDMFE